MYNKNINMNKEFLKMQKLAGLITEGQYKAKLNENEDKIMVDSTSLTSYIDEMISLSDDMEYTPDMVQALQDLKDELSNGEMSVENALDIIQQTIDITGDDIDAVESLGQAVDYDNDIINAARNIKGLD
jgi:hypothetical protein